MVVSDDHEGIKSALAGELPGVGWQRCVVHFERNALSHVPASSTAEVAQELKAIFKVGREGLQVRPLLREGIRGVGFPSHAC